jgi:diguanylate cyclase (GGDEF)-like protein/PAS domain S-box-containing protein
MNEPWGATSSSDMESEPHPGSAHAELAELRARLTETEQRLAIAEDRFAESDRRLSESDRRLTESERRLADAEQLGGIGWWDWDPDGAHVATFEQTPVGLAIVGLDGFLRRVNPAFCSFLEATGERLLARSLRDIGHPEDRLIDRDQIAGLLAGEITSFQVEKRCVTDTGAVRWGDASVSLVRQPDGRPGYFTVQVQDVTARKVGEQRLVEAEAEVRMRRDHAETIIGAMHDGYALTIDGEIRAVNASWCAMIGYSEAELLGMRPPYPFWVPDEIDQRMALRDRVVAAGGACFQITFERKDGSHFEAEVTATAAHGPDGEPIGFVNTLRDVSAINRDRRELERMARTDSLTGLANRFVLEKSLAHESGRRTGDRQLALVLLDLDRFKEINDVHGHPVGDSVLVEVAERLAHTVRSGEVLARLGGEEFAWLLPATGRDEAIVAADRARAAIACRPFGGAGELTMSAGVGVVDVPFDTDLLYELADRALYEAKQTGRNRTCCTAESGSPAAEPRARAIVQATVSEPAEPALPTAG